VRFQELRQRGAARKVPFSFPQRSIHCAPGFLRILGNGACIVFWPAARALEMAVGPAPNLLRGQRSAMHRGLRALRLWMSNRRNEDPPTNPR
jgi:hypothetical protein